MTEIREADLRRIVRETICRFAPAEPGSVDGRTRLIEDLEYHSLALLELAVALEDELDLPPWEDAGWDELSGFDVVSVAEVEDFVVAKAPGLAAADSGNE